MESNLFHGHITNVIDPNNVWLRFGTDHDKQLFADYQRNLDAFYNINRNIYTCYDDSLCTDACVVVADDVDVEVTDESSEQHWRRARVAQWNASTDTVDVFFIDLGYSAIVDRNRLRQGLPEIFDILPSQAISVSLAYVKPLAQSWTSRAKSFLDAQMLYKDVLVSFVMQDETSGQHAIAVYTKTPEGPWHSLIHEMETEELVLLNECTIPEFMDQETADAYLQHMNDLHEQLAREVTSPLQTEEPEYFSAEEDGNLDEDHVELNSLQEQQIDDPPHSDNRGQVPPNLDQGEKFPKDKLAIPRVDPVSLAQRTSFTISKLQQDRRDEIKRKATRDCMAELKANMADTASVSEDQDWETMGDFDPHDFIQNQIYKGLQRQISDSEVAQFTSDIEQLSRGIVPSRESPLPDQNASQVHDTKDETDTTKSTMIETSNEKVEISNERLINREKAKALREIENYEIIKKIQEILSRHDGKDADVVSASIHSIVEPDVDVSMAELSIVLYALLDHTMCKSVEEQEMTLDILETYSDTRAFVPAIHDVLLKLKEEFLKLAQSVRLDGKHKEFATMLSLIFTFSADWDQRSAKDIQEFILSFVSNWVIFNKNRLQTDNRVFDTELMFLECAEVVLNHCVEDLKEKFPETLADMMVEIRQKLLHDLSPRWIRERFLDLLLTLKCDSTVFRQTRKTTNASTQTTRNQAMTVVSHNTTSSDIRDCDIHHNRHLGDDAKDSSEKYVVDSSEKWPALQKSTADSCEKQPALRKTVTGESSLSRYSATPSLDALKRNQALKDLDSIMPVSLLDQSQNMYVPAESVSSHPRPKKKGFPKSIRNLPAHLLQICEGYTPAEIGFSQEDRSSAESSKNSPIDFDPNASAPCDQVLTLGGESESKEKDIPLESQEFPKTSWDSVLDRLNVSGNSLNEQSQEIVDELTGLTDNLSLSPQVTEINEEEKYVGDEAKRYALDEERGNACDESSLIHLEGSSTASLIVNPDSNVVRPDIEYDHQIEEENVQMGPVDVPKSDIKYTTAQLRKMNPWRSKCPLELEDLWEPHEVLTIMIAQEVSRLKLKMNSCHTTRELNSSPDHSDNVIRYDGIFRKSPLSVEMKATDSIYNVSNSQSSQQDFEHYENDQNLQTVLSNDLAHAPSKMSEIKGSLKNIGEDLLFSECLSAPESDFQSESQLHTSSTEEIEIWHEGNSKENMNAFSSTKKGKKKKIKFRPLDQVHLGNDGMAAATVDLENLDEFCDEALQMYTKLEKEDQHRAALTDGEIITCSRFGGSALSAPKRPSLFAEVRQHYQAPKSRDQWRPGKRKCTRCGSEDHTIYNCQQDSSSLYK